MKRTKAFFLTILAVMGLCSCGESSEVKPVKLAEDYKTPAEFTIDGTEYVASFTRGGADMWECEITAPETVSGMVITCSGESIGNGGGFEIKMTDEEITSARKCIDEMIRLGG